MSIDPQNLDNIFDSKYKLCHRARIARLKFNGFKWWRDQIDRASSENEIFFVLLMIYFYAAKKVFIYNLEKIQDRLTELDNTTFRKLLLISSNSYPFVKRNISLSENDLKKLNDRTILFVEGRLSKLSLNKVEIEKLEKYEGDSTEIIRIVVQGLAHQLSNNPNNLDLYKKVKKIYSETGFYFDFYFQRFLHYSDYSISYSVAKMIIEDCYSYPRILVNLAEEACRSKLSKEAVSVKKIADEERWFESD